MHSPLISILMPTYEPDASQLREAIESVRSQTETRWTLFIHDDASKTDVRSLVKPFLSDSRITFARSEQRLGIGGNWNACLRRASAPYVQYLFQDDAWKPHCLSTGLGILEKNPTIGFVSLEHDYTFEGAIETRSGYEALLRFRREQIAAGTHDGREFLQWWMDRGLHPNVIGEPSFVMMRKASCDAAGFFLEDMPQFLDVEYWTRLLRISDWEYVKDVHGFFRVHLSAASSRNQAEGRGLFDRLRCMEQTMNALEGTARRSAKRAIAAQLSQMIGKFLSRTKAGKAVKLEGSGAVQSFLLRHPLLAVRGFSQYLLKSNNN